MINKRKNNEKFLITFCLVAMASTGMSACSDGDKLDDAINSYCGKASEYVGGTAKKSDCAKAYAEDIDDDLSGDCYDAIADYLECSEHDVFRLSCKKRLQYEDCNHQCLLPISSLIHLINQNVLRQSSPTFL